MHSDPDARFRADFRTLWLIATAVIMVPSSVALRSGSRDSLFIAGCALTVAISMFFSQRPALEPPPARTIRLRFALIAVCSAVFLIAGGRYWRLVALAAAVWLGLLTAFAGVVYRKSTKAGIGIALFLVLGDFLAISALAMLGSPWLVVAGLLMLAAHADLLLHPEDGTFWFTALLVMLSAGLLRNSNPYDAEGFPAAYFILLLTLVCAGTSLLSYYGGERRKKSAHSE